MPTSRQQDSRNGVGDKVVDKGRWDEMGKAWNGISLLHVLPALFTLIGPVFTFLFPSYSNLACSSLVHAQTIVRHRIALSHLYVHCTNTRIPLLFCMSLSGIYVETGSGSLKVKFHTWRIDDIFTILFKI